MVAKLIKSEQGFLTATLLALLPLILTLGLGFAVSSRVLFQWHQTHKICRNESMKLQKQLGELLKSLMLLNPVAHKLRADKIIAAAKLAIAVAEVNPPLIAFYTAKLEMIQAKQINLDRKQKLILSMAKVRLLKWQTSMFAKLQPKTLGPMRLEHRFNEALAVEPSPRGDMAPAYNLRTHFEQEQMAGAKWFSSLNRMLPQQLQTFLQSNRILPGECYATLKKRRLSWIPALSEAKPLWK